MRLRTALAPLVHRRAAGPGGLGVDVGAYRLSLYGLLSAIIVTVLLYSFVRVTLKALKWVLRRNSSIDDTQRILTEKLLGIGLFTLAAFVGIDLLDHIIFNRTGYFSFLEAGTL